MCPDDNAASVHRRAPQLGFVSIRILEVKIELIVLKPHGPVDHFAISQEAAFEHKGTVVLPAPFVGDEGIVGTLGARTAIESNRFREGDVLAARLVGMDRKLEGGGLA